MKKINILKNDIEVFLDGLEIDFNRLKNKLILFNEFKSLFCNDCIDLSSTINISTYKEIYLNISSSNSKFYSKIRKYIIDCFLVEYSYCPYCGKTPLIYFDENNKTKRMFQFDHFIPKNKYEKGIINFYNLIPSCNACNHLKSDIFPGDGVFHPYFGWIEKRGNTFDLIGDNFDDFSFCDSDINGKKSIFTTEHAKYFRLNQIYQKSIRDNANVFDFIRDKEVKMKVELKGVTGKFRNGEEAKRYFFDNYYSPDKNEVTHYQNGKLKKDLIDNLRFNTK